MRGYVLTFRPRSGEGTIVSDSGESFGFVLEGAADDLSGGDVVSFEAVSAGGHRATEVRRIGRATEQIDSVDRDLLTELFSEVRAGGLASQPSTIQICY